ncbi:unnamed protein product [Plutella xylostella]|uniref:(diamondback moth) hypothetical protein n=1 Tax=Plutella xylostella TaxID=51655 RepID=A0A8S4D1A5_PLUXY|nr:unnamed protein product [Plutella xylostella]
MEEPPTVMAEDELVENPFTKRTFVHFTNPTERHVDSGADTAGEESPGVARGGGCQEHAKTACNLDGSSHRRNTYRDTGCQQGPTGGYEREVEFCNGKPRKLGGVWGDLYSRHNEGRHRVQF